MGLQEAYVYEISRCEHMRVYLEDRRSQEAMFAVYEYMIGKII